MPTAQYIDYVNTLHTDPENYALLLAILLIPRGKEYNEGYDIHENAALFEEHFSWADVQAIAFFQSAITRIHKTYAKLFESEAEEGNEEGEESGAGGSYSDNYRSFQNRWKWNIIIEHISSYTRFDFERVCKLELMEFLNHASYVKSKIQYHNNQVKKQMAELKKRRR